MRRVTLAGLLLAVSVVAGPVEASPGSRADNDDVATPLDIRAVYHADSGSGSSQQIEYYVESYTDFTDEQLLCGWELDVNGDRTRDIGIQLGGEGGLNVTAYNAQGQSSGDGSALRTAVASPHSSPTSTASNTVKVTIARSTLGTAGFPAADEDYDYIAQCGFDRPGAAGERDNAPDDGMFPGIRHALGAASAEECPGHQGDARPDVLGTPGNDRIAGITNSIVCGLGGNDIVRASPDGATLVEGNDGSDVLCARQASAGDVLDGGTGIDRGRYENAESAASVERLASISLCA